MELAVIILIVLIFLPLMLWVNSASERLGRNDESMAGLRAVIDKMNKRIAGPQYKGGSNEKLILTIWAKLKILNHDNTDS